MESTFSAQYQATRQADGSLHISYRAKSYHMPGFMQQMAILILPGLFYVCFTAMALHVAPVLGIVMLALLVAFVVVIVRGIARSVTVLPGQGIAWGNNRLPFRDISDFGVMKVSTHYGESGYVFAESRGREIPITRHIPMALASAIRDEIQSATHTN